MKNLIKKCKTKITIGNIGWSILILLFAGFISTYMYVAYQFNYSDQIYRNSDCNTVLISETSTKLYLVGIDSYLEDIGYFQDGIPDFKFTYKRNGLVNSPGSFIKSKPSDEEILLFQKEKKIAEKFYAKQK